MIEKQFNKEKFKELMLYIADRSERDDRFGATKLNKILYYSDFIAYRLLGNSITGADYQKLDEGPAPVQLLASRKELIKDKSAKIEFRPYFNVVQQRLIAKRKPDLSKLHKREVDIVDEVLEELWSLNGDEVSDRSHKEIGYRLAYDGEVIPYASAFLSYEPLSLEQWELGKQIAGKYECSAQTI